MLNPPRPQNYGYARDTRARHERRASPQRSYQSRACRLRMYFRRVEPPCPSHDDLIVRSSHSRTEPDPTPSLLRTSAGTAIWPWAVTLECAMVMASHYRGSDTSSTWPMYYGTQVSSLIPGTIPKCFTLLVTSTAPRSNACAAIRISMLPSGVPRFSRIARIRA